MRGLTVSRAAGPSVRLANIRVDGSYGTVRRSPGRQIQIRDGRDSETEGDHLADLGVHDHRLGRELAQCADDGRLWPGVRVPLHRAGDRVPDAAGAGRRGAGVGLVRRRLPLGERGHLAALGPVGRLVPVRDDDLLLPDAAGVRREHAGVRVQSGSRDERRLYGGGHRRGLLERRVPVGARRHRWHRETRLERASSSAR